MATPRAAGLVLALVTMLMLGACSDEEAPGWLEDLALEAASTTTTVAVTTTSPTTTVPADRGGATPVLDIEKGTCIVDAPFTQGAPVEVVDLPTIDCGRPHRAEVYDVVQLPQQQGAPFPGEALVARARQACLDRFESFVGLAWIDSELEFVALRPTELSWAEGDRAIACVLFRPDGKDLEGSARGAAF